MSNEVKPIVVIYIPDNLGTGEGLLTPFELMSVLNGNFGNQDTESKVEYSDYWKDYLWFVFYDDDISTPRFKVFYPKDFTEIQYEELRKLVEENLNKVTEKNENN